MIFPCVSAGDVFCTLYFSVDQLATAPSPHPLHSLLPGCANVTTRPPSYGHYCEALALGLCNCKHAVRSPPLPPVLLPCPSCHVAH